MINIYTYGYNTKGKRKINVIFFENNSFNLLQIKHPWFFNIFLKINYSSMKDRLFSEFHGVHDFFHNEKHT